MQFSPFNVPFKEEIGDWNDKLMLVSETLEYWLKVRPCTLYLWTFMVASVCS